MITQTFTMPYAEPTSPVPSPTEKHAFRKRYLTPPTHFEQVEAGPSSLTGPMPGIPRRSSSNQSGSPTPRRMMSPAVSRQSSSTYQSFPSSRPMEGMPRRPSADKPLQGLTGLPSGSSGGNLGLHLHPSPTKALTQRDAQDIPSSTSTVDSPLPSTPADEPHDLPLGRTAHHEDIRSDPFQSFESPHKPSFSHPPHRSALSPPRPPFLSRRSSSQGHHRGNETTGSLPMKFSSSASATHLPNANHHRVISSQPVRLTASMIRKKSGEIVKPSLKARSMSTPDLFRQGDGSEPTTPEDERERGFPEERSKSVRFAGEEEDDGAALESVVLFLREQKPIAVGKAADPEQAALLTETETEVDTDASDFVQFRTRRNAAARAADEAERIVLEGGSRVPRLRVDFAPDARGSLLNEHVVLERAELVNGIGPLSLRGSVIVRNISFQKSVAVRFTLDHWQ